MLDVITLSPLVCLCVCVCSVSEYDHDHEAGIKCVDHCVDDLQICFCQFLTLSWATVLVFAQ